MSEDIAAYSEAPSAPKSAKSVLDLGKSTSLKKIEMIQKRMKPVNIVEKDPTERCIIEIGVLRDILAVFPCPNPDCKQIGYFDISFNDNNMGFSRELNIVCKDCLFSLRRLSCARKKNSNHSNKGLDVNDAVVTCFNELGLGHAGITKMSSLLNMRGMHKKTYQRLSKKVGKAHVEAAEAVIDASADAVREAYSELDADDGEDDVIADVGDEVVAIETEGEGSNDQGSDIDSDDAAAASGPLDLDSGNRTSSTVIDLDRIGESQVDEGEGGESDGDEVEGDVNGGDKNAVDDSESDESEGGESETSTESSVDEDTMDLDGAKPLDVMV